MHVQCEHSRYRCLCDTVDDIGAYCMVCMAFKRSLHYTVPNYGSEVYGDDSIGVEVNTTLGDCLPRGGTPRCYQRQVVQQNETNELAFSINIYGKQALVCIKACTNEQACNIEYTEILIFGVRAVKT